MRRVLLSITNFILFLLLLVFIVVSSIEEVTIDTLYNTMLPAKIRQSVSQYNPNVTLTEDEVKTIIKNYVKVVTNNDINLEKEVKKIIDNYELTDEQKEQIILISLEEAKTIKKTMFEQESEKQEKMINLYNKMTKKETKTAFYVIAVILVILLIVIEKALLEWILKLGFNFLIIGFSYMFIFPSIADNLKTGIQLNYQSINNYGAKYASLGIICIIVFCLLETIRINFFLKEEED